MKPARIVDLDFNYISEQRANRMKWAGIERLLKAKGYRHSRGYLKSLYEKELAKRTSPERKLRVKWLYQNYEGIFNLLAKGLQWDLVLMLVPLEPKIGNPPPDFPGFIADYELIAEAMTSHDWDGALSSETLLKETETLPKFFANLGSDQWTAEAPSEQAGVPEPSKRERIFGSWD